MMTIEDFAVSIQADLSSLRRDMNAGFAELHASVADLREEMIERCVTHSELQSGLDSLKEELLAEIDKIKYAKEIDELRRRTARIEYEIGIGPRASPA